MATNVNANQQDPQVRQAERAKPTEELGASGLMTFFGQVEEAYLAELRWPGAYAKFNEMRRRNPTIASLLNAISTLARTASWTVEPAGTSDPDKQAAEFLEQCLADMSITVEDAVEDLLTAVPFGWAWSEIVYKRRQGPGADPESKYDDGRFGWRKFAPRRQSSFYKWEFDPEGGLQGLWQSIPMDDQPTRYVPISKSLHFTALRDQGNPEGMSILEPAYEDWHFLKNLNIIGGIGFERAFVGLPVFEYAEGYTPSYEDKRIVASTGKGLRVDEKAFVAVPANVKFRLETVSNTNAEALLNRLKYHAICILQIVLADFIALGTTASGGSYSLGQDKSAIFLMVVDGLLDKLAHPDKLGVLNRYAVPRLFRYNTFEGITDYPKIKHSTVQKPSLQALSDYLSALTAYIKPDAKLEEQLRREANLPPIDVETREKPQPAPFTGLPGQAQPTADPNAASPAGANTKGPETGDQGDTAMGGDGVQMSHQTGDMDPHPPARGQRWFQMDRWTGEFENCLAEFRSAVRLAEPLAPDAAAPAGAAPQVTVNVPAPEVTVNMPAPQVTVNVPEQAAPSVTVNNQVQVPEQPAPQVSVQPMIEVSAPPQPVPHVTVNVPEQPVTVNVSPQPAPQITVQVPEPAPPQVTVNVPEQPAPQVTVNVPVAIEEDARILRDSQGRITGMEKKIEYRQA